jgi:hypothetical protein
MNVSFEAYGRESSNHSTYEEWLQAKVREAERHYQQQQQNDQRWREKGRHPGALTTREPSGAGSVAG